MKNDTENNPGKKYRKAAEEQLARKKPEFICKAESTEVQKLIQELQIHQIELEMQNEELINANQISDELREDYQTLFTIAPVGYLVMGPNSMIIRCNVRAADLFGTTPEHMEGRRLGVFLDQTTLGAFNTFYQNCCTKKTGPPCEFGSRSGHTLLSDPRHLHFFGQRLQSDNDACTCIVAISDETEVHQYQGALQEVNRKLHLLSNITRHDILNQVMVLAGSLELVRMKREESLPIDADLQRCELAKKTIYRLAMFTHEYANLGVEKPTWQSASAVVEKVLPKTAISVTIDPSLVPIEVYADLMLSSVFFNLFQNAEEHGGDISNITVSFHQNGREGILVVEDDGVGIPDDIKDQVFVRGIGKGTGLGLFFTSEILAITGIHINETGTAETGARFELRIPVGVWRSQKKFS